MTKPKRDFVDRQPRQCTYLIANVSKPGFLKIFSCDAQLIDLSTTGMKLKFANKIKAKTGDTFIVKLPHPKIANQFVRFEVETRWVSEPNGTLGVVVCNVGEMEASLIEYYIDVSRKMGRKVV